jgi:hypothetical protein
MQRKQPLAVTGVEHDQQQQRMDLAVRFMTLGGQAESFRRKLRRRKGPDMLDTTPHADNSAPSSMAVFVHASVLLLPKPEPRRNFG